MMNTLFQRIILLFAMSASAFSNAENYQFDTNQLDSNSGKIDLSIFNDGGQLPGIYPVDIYVNNTMKSHSDVFFYNEKRSDSKPILKPCLSSKLLSEISIKLEVYPSIIEINTPEGKLKCIDIEVTPETKSIFNLASKELFLSVPLIAVQKEMRGIAPEAMWDNGIDAFRMNYDIDISKKMENTESIDKDEIKGLLQPGLNLGSWRFRNVTGFSRRTGSPLSWQRGNTYMSTSFPSIKSTLTVGDVSPFGEVFKPLPILGIMLNTEESMFPFYERTFSPVVKGVAKTHARVTVSNNGTTIFEDLVPPGPFVLNDFSLGAQKGELLVKIEEDNGENIIFTVPWQAPTVAVPEGHLKYSFAAGEYKGISDAANNQNIYQSTAIYGFNDKMTFYTGYQGAKNYNALLNGGGVSLGNYGSTSIDYTVSRDASFDSRTSGLLRLRYSINNETYGTGLHLETSHYMGAGAGSLADAIARANELSVTQKSRKHEHFLTLSQTAGDYGSLYINASKQDNSDGTKNFNLGGGYGFTVKGMGTLTLDMYEQNNIDSYNQKNKQRFFSLALSIPFSQVMEIPINASYRWSLSHNSSNEDYSISGYSSEKSFFWNLSNSLERTKLSGKIKSTSAQVNWNTNAAQFGAWHSESMNWKASGAKMYGGLLIHSEGITTGKQFGETISLVNVRGASDVNILNGNNTHTDSRGYAIISSVSPYQKNRISLDTTKLENDVEISLTDVDVTPTRGAIVSAKYKVITGKKLLLKLKRNKGKPIPFGAIASLYGGESTGIVDELGRVFMSGLPYSGKIKIQWSQEYCDVIYNVNDENTNAGLRIIDATCI
ncbi:fimbria/pilus outer membrane usher protein (plasmid) [Enterobacter asburiae]|uniref:fimbria/pilus outer membrane usher protein n=1 Tax=Enterobacter sp. 262D3 TaxID=3077763 RepID=UPI002A7F1CA2|nr:fimbria/pilus outer membrane usher protein [Enterobacter sp. 262D3]